MLSPLSLATALTATHDTFNMRCRAAAVSATKIARITLTSAATGAVASLLLNPLLLSFSLLFLFLHLEHLTPSVEAVVRFLPLLKGRHCYYYYYRLQQYSSRYFLVAVSPFVGVGIVMEEQTGRGTNTGTGACLSSTGTRITFYNAHKMSRSVLPVFVAVFCSVCLEEGRRKLMNGGNIC